jgi:hypothetical protein
MIFDIEFEEKENFDVEFTEQESSFPTDFASNIIFPQGKPENAENGATFFPHVSESGVLSWTNNKDLPNPEPVNITGPQGPIGPEGPKGADGKDGTNGTNGTNGKDGVDGKTPYIQNGYWYIGGVNTNVKAQGVDGEDGAKGDKGDKGDQGIQGEKGVDGYTPVKGIDYFTEADKTEIVQAIIIALPKYNGEVIEL